MLQLQVTLLTAWRAASDALNRRIDDERDRGEVTATTAIIVILVIAAIAAGGVIAAKIANNAEAIPEP
jgi:heme A synthase